MSLQHRLKQLERKAGINQPQHITLINPDKEDIERASKVPNAVVYIIEIGGPKTVYGLPAEDGCQ